MSKKSLAFKNAFRPDFDPTIRYLACARLTLSQAREMRLNAYLESARKRNWEIDQRHADACSNYQKQLDVKAKLESYSRDQISELIRQGEVFLILINGPVGESVKAQGTRCDNDVSLELRHGAMDHFGKLLYDVQSPQVKHFTLSYEESWEYMYDYNDLHAKQYDGVSFVYRFPRKWMEQEFKKKNRYWDIKPGHVDFYKRHLAFWARKAKALIKEAKQYLPKAERRIDKESKLFAEAIKIIGELPRNRLGELEEYIRQLRTNSE